MLTVAGHSKIADLMAKPLDFAGERFDRVPGDQHVCALPGLLGFDTANCVAVVVESLLNTGGGI